MQNVCLSDYFPVAFLSQMETRFTWNRISSLKFGPVMLNI